MALVQTFDDLRKYVRFTSTSNIKALPDFTIVEALHLKPIIGTALLNKLNTDYSTNNVSNASTAYVMIHQHAQRYIANMAMAENLATYHTLITDSGIRTQETANMAAAHSWEFKQLRDNLYRSAAQSLEMLIQALFFFKADLTEWTSSNEYKQLNSLAVKTATDFNDHYRLYDPFRTYFLLVPTMKNVQEMVLIPAFGRQLTKWLIEQTEAKFTYKTVEINLIDYLKKAVVFYSLKAAMINFSTQFTSGGFTILQTGDSEEPSIAGRKEVGDHKFNKQLSDFENQGAAWLKDLMFYVTKAFETSGALNTDFRTAYQASPLVADYDNNLELPTKNNLRKIWVAGG